MRYVIEKKEDSDIFNKNPEVYYEISTTDTHLATLKTEYQVQKFKELIEEMEKHIG